MRKPRVDRRRGRLRRQLNDAGEAKIMALFGQFTCLWLLIWYTDQVLHTEYTLLTLLVFIVAPDSIKKFLNMRFGAGGK